MNPKILYLVDDKDEARWANVPALQRLLDSPDIKVEPLVPFPQFSQFNDLLKNPDLGGFFIDQKMRGGGVVTYNGIELAGQTRLVEWEVAKQGGGSISREMLAAEILEMKRLWELAAPKFTG